MWPKQLEFMSRELSFLINVHVHVWHICNSFCTSVEFTTFQWKFIYWHGIFSFWKFCVSSLQPDLKLHTYFTAMQLRYQSYYINQNSAQHTFYTLLDPYKISHWMHCIVGTKTLKGMVGSIVCLRKKVLCSR